jgi:tagatose-6-phosphate ketose/aldose isomerase
MFEKDTETLKSMGAEITTREIRQQPELWEGTLKIFDDNIDAIKSFVERARVLGGTNERTHVVFTGAGTSAYVGDTVTPYLRRHGDSSAFRFDAIATTDIVAAPLDYLRPEDPTVLVSFARSGNSPESLAAVERAGQVVNNILYLNITCAPEGHLAQQFKDDSENLTLLIPGANDQGFAMTGSYSCMELLAALIFDTRHRARTRAPGSQRPQPWDARSSPASLRSRSGSTRTSTASPTSAPAPSQARHASASSRSSSCAHGLIATSFDSSMGYRHGPKSFVDGKTLVFDLVHNDPYTRQYDLDILNEIAGDKIRCPHHRNPAGRGDEFEGESFTFGSAYAPP